LRSLDRVAKPAVDSARCARRRAAEHRRSLVLDVELLLTRELRRRS
jgi:hypothetical protein